MAARFVVGIDLGTTNSVVAYVAGRCDRRRSRCCRIPQLIAPGTRRGALCAAVVPLPAGGGRARRTRPCSCRGAGRPTPSSARSRSGAAARSRTASSPRRSRGCRTPAPIAPRRSCRGTARDDVRKLSPVEVSARYLAHLAAAWNAAFPKAPLAEQDVLLTVPASFDPVARELTVRAAREAGLPQVTMLEEPQAALYAWIDANGEAWRDAVGGRRRPAGLRRRRRHHRLQPDRRARRGRRARARARRRRRSHPARRRQHGPRPRLRRARAPGRARHGARRLAAARAWWRAAATPRNGCSPPRASPRCRWPSSAAAARWSAARCAPTSSAPTSSSLWSTASSRAARLSDRPQAPRRSGLQEIGLPYASRRRRHPPPGALPRAASAPPAPPRGRPRCCSTAA